MNLSLFEATLLTGAVTHLDELLGEPLKSSPWSYGREKQRWNAQDANIVDVDLERFLGHPPSPSERNKATAAYKRLESLGLLIRIEHQWSKRTRALQVTQLGRDWVKDQRQTNTATLPLSVGDPQPVEVPFSGGEGSTDGTT